MTKPQILVAASSTAARLSASSALTSPIVQVLFISVALLGSVPSGSAQIRESLSLGPGAADGSIASRSSSGAAFEGGASAAFSGSGDSQRIYVVRHTRAFSAVGVGVHVGLNGAGFDVATPLSGKLNLRVGGDFFSYSDTFETSGTNVNADLHLMSGHAALDWFPGGGSFRLSPGVTLANNNRVRASAVVPAGSTITLNGSDYTSSVTDPLHGSGSIDFRKTAPGLTVGFGNLVPRRGGHFSFPIDLGFIYVGQPRLKVAFTGSACESGQPPAIGCQPVDQYSEFQSSLAAFRNRINKDLDYANFYPVLSAGVGYSF